MKANLFENKYKPSNAVKVFFADVVCFLIVTILSIGFCYSYFSGSAGASGSSRTANVAVQYQYNGVAVTEIYGTINDGAVRSLTNATFTPGDKIVIVGSAYNLSNVPVYVLAKLEIVTNNGTITEWYNIGSNDPAYSDKGIQLEDDDVDALTEYLKLNKVAQSDGKEIHQVGAGSLGASKYKNLAIPYEFKGSEYDNDDTITSINLTLHVHQKAHLRSDTSDFVLYTPYEHEGKINGYDTESIYATHQMTGDLLVAD